MKKPLVLFISAGRTDLKIFATEQDRCCAVEIESDSIRLFHQWLFDHPEQYVIEHQGDDEIPLYQKPQRNMRLNIDVKETALSFSGQNVENLALLTDEDRYIIVPVKLGKIIAHFQEQQDYEIVAAVVLNTHRDATSRFGKNEPFAGGFVLAKWLSECFDLTFSKNQQPEKGKSVWINLLDGNQDFDAEKGSDLINSIAVNRLIKALTIFSSNPDLHIGICGIGGIPKFKNLIRDSAFFYFSERCLIAEDSENENTAPIIKKVGNFHLTVEQSFSLRASVTKLIQSGDFLGAEAAVCHVSDKEHQLWIKPINDVARLFRGFDADSNTDNQNQEINALLAKVRDSDKGCILAALRAEAALQSSSWVDAMSWTSSFYDAAFFDAIARLLDTWGGEYQVNINDRTVTYSTNDFIKQMRLQRGYRGAIAIPNDMKQKRIDKKNPPTSFPLEYKGQEGNSYLLDTMGKIIGEKWRKEINSLAINNLFKALDSKIDGNSSPKFYRNISTHRVLNSANLENAKNAYKNAGLWGANGNLLFLEQPLVVAVLEDLNIPEVGQWYKQLVELLLKNLQNFRWYEQN